MRSISPNLRERHVRASGTNSSDRLLSQGQGSGLNCCAKLLKTFCHIDFSSAHFVGGLL